MRKLLLILFCLPIIGFSQLKVAILDFENTSGIAKYDGFGKAMSNMLITDLKNNIHPRKVVFMERSQLNKIFDEQNLQKSKKFDKSTAVNFGKLSGVDFVIVGNIHVLGDICNISSRMVNIESSEIEHSKDVNGNITNWINLKSQLALEFADAVNNPISIENSDETTSEGVLVQYAKIIEAIDQENIELAEGMIQMMKDLQIDFNYLDFLNEDIQKIKERLENLELELEISVTDPIGSANNFYDSEDYMNSIKYLKIGRNRLGKNDVGGLIYYYLLLHQSCLEIDFKESLKYCDSILDIYPYFEYALQAKYETLYNNGKYSEALAVLKIMILDYDIHENDKVFRECIDEFRNKNNIDDRMGGYTYSTSYTTGWRLTLNTKDPYHHQYEYHQGVSFDTHLSWLIECMESLYSLQELVTFLESVVFSAPGFIDKNNMMKEDPYYLPSSRYKPFNNYSEEIRLYFAKNNTSYNGDYHKLSNNKKWTQIGPRNCPCELLFTQEEITENNAKKTSIEITSKSQFHLNFLLGWFYLKNNQPTESIKTYINILDYFKENSYFWVMRGDITKHDMYVMSTINMGHGYLMSGDIDKAEEIYRLYRPETKIHEFDMTIKEALIQDWEEFHRDGMLSKKEFILIKEELNIK